jgi:hypothetical protein
MFEQAYKLPTRAVQTLCSALGMSFFTGYAELTAVHLRPDSNGIMRPVKHPNRLKALLGFHDVRYGHKCVTDAFVAYVVDNLQAELAAFGDFKFHDSGTGVVAEAAADTGLGTPCGEARDAGTQIEGATANIYKSVATHTYAGAFAITEHGLFNIAAAGTLMDRTKFAAINVAIGDGIQFTFQITFTAGG